MPTIKVKSCNLSSTLVRAVVPGLRPGNWTVRGHPVDVFPCTADAQGNTDTSEVVFPASLVNSQPYSLFDLVDNGQAFTTTPLNYEQNPLLLALESSEIVVVAQDGKEYVFKLQTAAKKLIKHGQYIATIRYWGRSVTDTGLTGLGIHVYATVRSDNLIRIGLRISNGNINTNGSGVLGNFFVANIHWKLPQGHVLKEDCARPYYGVNPGNNSFVLFKNGLHEFLKQQGWVREFIFCQTTSLPAATLVAQKFDTGFAVDAWNTTKAFLTQKSYIGKITNAFVNWYNVHGYDGYRDNLIRDRLIPTLNAIRSGNVNTTSKFYSASMGSFHPYFDSQEGQVAGDGIEHFSGYSLTVEEIQLLSLLAQASIDRQRWYMYSPAGKVITIHDFAEAFGGIIPFEYQGNASQDLPFFLQAGNANAGFCRYHWSLLNYKKHDFSHLIRITRLFKTLAQLTNDPLYIDELEMAAENCHLQYHEYPHVPNGWSPGNDLRTMAAIAASNPGHGFGMLVRAFVWPIDAINAYYLFAPQRWRIKNKPVLELAADFIGNAKSANGWVQNYWWPHQTTGVPDEYRTAQTFEQEFLDYLRNGLVRSVFAGNDSARTQVLLRDIITSTQATHFGAVPNPHQDGSYSPNRFVAVQDAAGNMISPFTVRGGGDESFYGWHQLCAAILAAQELNDPATVSSLTNRILFLKKMKNDVQLFLMQEAKNYWNDHLPNAIALLGEIQNGRI